MISVNFRESYDTVVGLTPEFDGLSHKDQIKLKEIEVVAVIRSMTAVTAETDDPNGLPSNPFIFLLTQICLDSLRSSALLPATITCHGESRGREQHSQNILVLFQRKWKNPQKKKSFVL